MAKTRLRENFSIDWQEPLSLRRLPLQESTKIVEANGKEYLVLERWEVPVWRLNKKNLNGRTYRESLGKRFVEEYKDTVTANLADHPEEDGSVKDILAVSKNPHIRDGILYVDSYIVDEAFEKKLNKMVEAGFGLGVSSSILGELDESNNVIDESAELERWYDFVNSPSYQVYVTKESKQTESIKETIEKEIIKEKLTIDNKETLMSDKLRESMEKATRLNLEQLLKEADKKDTIALRISALEEALTYTSDEFLSDMRKSIEEKISNLKAESLVLAEQAKNIPVLEESVKTHEAEKISINEKVASLEKEVASLNEKLSLATKLIDESKEASNKAETLIEMANAEKSSRFTASEYYELVKTNESLDVALASIVNEKAVLEDRVRELEEANKASTLELAAIKEELSKKKEEVDLFKKDIEDGVMNEEEGIDYSTGEFSYFPDEEEDDELELDVYQTPEIEDYYESLLAGNPNYKKIKEDILKCKTLIEAQTTALRLAPLVEDIKRPSFLGDSSRKVDESKGREIIDNIDVRKLKRNGWK